MPQILVLTDSPRDSGEVVYRERVARSCLESEHFSHQLLERVNWAVEDADVREHEAEAHETAPAAEAMPAQREPQPAWHPPVAAVR
jgi:hypothetical protein